MNTDHLTAFYASRQGTVVRDLIARGLSAHWPSLRGQSVLALGYSYPWRDCLAQLDSDTIVMASSVGHKQNNTNRESVVCDHTHLPLTNQSIDRAFLIHAVDNTPDIHALLREVWRVTSRTARILIVAANRMGLWTHGTAFARHCALHTRGDFEAMLVDSMFTPQRHSYALHAPDFLYRHGSFWDTPMRALVPGLGSAILIEANKMLCAAPKRALARKTAIARPARGTLLASLLDHGKQSRHTIEQRARSTFDRRSPSGITPHRSFGTPVQ